MRDHRTTLPVTIRPATAGDAIALERVAGLDSSHVPSGRMLVAEVGGDIRAGLALSTGSVVADPFFPTSHLVSLLRVRAAATAPATVHSSGAGRIMGGVRHALATGR